MGNLNPVGVAMNTLWKVRLIFCRCGHNLCPLEGQTCFLLFANKAKTLVKRQDSIRTLRMLRSKEKHIAN